MTALAAGLGVAAFLLGIALAQGAPRETPELRAAQDTAQIATRVVSLDLSWNLVGWPVDTPLDDVLATLPDAVTVLEQFDPQTGDFETFTKGLPPSLNSLTTLIGGRGTWVFAEALVTWLTPAFPTDGLRTLSLVAGFNLVTWFGPDGVVLADAAAELGSAFSGAFGWGSSAQAFSSFDPTRPGFLNDFTVLNNGDAFWVRTNAATNWDQPVRGPGVTSDDGLITVRAPFGSAANVTIRTLAVDSLPPDLFTEQDEATILAVYEIQGGAGLTVEYDLPPGLQVAQAEGETTTADTTGATVQGDGGVALGRVVVQADGTQTPAPLDDQRTESNSDRTTQSGTLPEATPSGEPTPGGPDGEGAEDEEDEDSSLIVVTGFGDAFQVVYLPSFIPYAIGASVPLRVFIDNLGTEPITNVRLTTDAILPFVDLGRPNGQTGPQAVASIRGGGNWAFGISAEGLCVREGGGPFILKISGTAPVAPQGQFAKFSKAFTITKVPIVECKAPTLVYTNTFNEPIETNAHVAVVRHHDGQDEFGGFGRFRVSDDAYTPVWSMNLLCGEQLTSSDPWAAAYFHGAPHGPNSQGCAVAPEVNSTVTLTVTQDLPAGAGTCTFTFTIGARDVTGRQDRARTWTSQGCPNAPLSGG